MRRSDTSKQRLWLGAGKYRDGGRDAGTNSDRFANSCIERYSVRAGNANPYTDSYGDRHTYGNSDCHGHADCNSVTNADGNGHSYSISDTYCYTKSDTEASADSTSSAVRCADS